MARLNSADELEALRRQQIELAKRIKEVELKRREKEKADNERREQLAGRAVLAYLATNPHSDVAKGRSSAYSKPESSSPPTAPSSLAFRRNLTSPHVQETAKQWLIGSRPRKGREPW